MKSLSSLCSGYLTGKIKPGMKVAPENTRIWAASKDTVNVAALAVPINQMVNTELFNRVISACDKIAKKHGI